MAKIRINATHSDLGPVMPTDHGARICKATCEFGGMGKELILSIGDCSIIVWPAVPDKIDKLGDRLKKLAEEMRHEQEK